MSLEGQQDETVMLVMQVKAEVSQANLPAAKWMWQGGVSWLILKEKLLLPVGSCVTFSMRPGARAVEPEGTVIWIWNGWALLGVSTHGNQDLAALTCVKVNTSVPIVLLHVDLPHQNNETYKQHVCLTWSSTGT